MIRRDFFYKRFFYRFPHILAFAKFGVVGASTAIIYFFLMWLLDYVFCFGYVVSISFAYFFSTAFHFFANKYFTFESQRVGVGGQIVRYFFVWVANYLITIGVVNVVVERYFMSPYFGVCVSVIFTMITGYFLGRYWVFKVKG